MENRNHYWNPYYNIFFFHDFSKYKSLEKQYYFVKEKYERRIERFYEKIQKPTLFIRYISSEIKEDDKSTELAWIEDNYEKILCVLQKYNTNNDIIFLGDEDTHSSIIKIYNVNRDDNDTVSRSPICNNSELFPIITGYSIMGQEENVQRFLKKEAKKSSALNRIIRKIETVYNRIFVKEYIHSKTYSISGK